MGILSSISDAVYGATNWLGITKPVQVGTPKSSITSPAMDKPTYAKTPVINPDLKGQVGSAILATSVIGASAVPIVKSVAGIVIKTATEILKSAGSTVGKAFTGLKPLTKVGVVAAGVPVALTVVQSKKAKEAIVKTPSSVMQFTGNVAKFVDDPSLQSGKQTIQDNPYISGIVGLGVAAVTYSVFKGTAGQYLFGKGLASGGGQKDLNQAKEDLVKEQAQYYEDAIKQQEEQAKQYRDAIEIQKKEIEKMSNDYISKGKSAAKQEVRRQDIQEKLDAAEESAKAQEKATKEQIDLIQTQQQIEIQKINEVYEAQRKKDEQEKEAELAKAEAKIEKTQTLLKAEKKKTKTTKKKAKAKKKKKKTKKIIKKKKKKR